MGGSADRASSENQALGQLQANQKQATSPGVQNLLAQYGAGNMSLNDAINQGMAQGTQTVDPYSGDRAAYQHSLDQLKGSNDYGSSLAKDQIQKKLDALPAASQVSSPEQFMDRLATNSVTGSMFAKDQVMKDPTLAGMFNKGGLLDQSEGQYSTASNDLGTDRQSLMGRDESYGLKDSDLKAYGQASGNIGRMYGNNEKTLAQSLANRGLASGPSGAANLAYSNMAGNQNEQLAQAQQQIAQNRIQTARGLAQDRTNMDLQRQSQAGNLATNLGGLGQSAINAQFGRQLMGSEDAYNKQAGAAALTSGQQGLQQGINNAAWAQEQASSPAGVVGGIVGNAVGGFGGAVGQSLGSKLGSKI